MKLLKLLETFIDWIDKAAQFQHNLKFDRILLDIRAHYINDDYCSEPIKVKDGFNDSYIKLDKYLLLAGYLNEIHSICKTKSMI